MIELKAQAKKGAFVRTIAREVASKIATVRGYADPQLIDQMERAREAAVRLSLSAPNGATVLARISIEEDPFGGYNTQLMVDVDPPRKK